MVVSSPTIKGHGYGGAIVMDSLTMEKKIAFLHKEIHISTPTRWQQILEQMVHLQQGSISDFSFIVHHGNVEYTEIKILAYRLPGCVKIRYNWCSAVATYTATQHTTYHYRSEGRRLGFIKHHKEWSQSTTLARGLTPAEIATIKLKLHQAMQERMSLSIEMERPEIDSLCQPGQIDSYLTDLRNLNKHRNHLEDGYDIVSDL